MTVGKKRYYAVARGRKPGIYTAWSGPDGAQAQVTGFADAVFKGFPTYQDARRFLETALTPGQRTTPNRRKPVEQEIPPSPGKGTHIYTDGGCINNPGPGGWAAVILNGENRTEISGGYRLTTNNRMELQACIQALRCLGGGAKADLFTDSQYVAKAVENGWALRWRSRNWMRDKTHRAENADLWGELLDLLEDREVSFHWVRGHAGNQENERCDKLARRAALGGKLMTDEEYEKGGSKAGQNLWE